MKIQESLEQLARHNLQRRTGVGQIDVTTEKLKRFNAILDMFADDGGDQKSDPGLSVLTLMSAPIQSSSYGRILQALSNQKVSEPPPPGEIKLQPPGPAEPTPAVVPRESGPDPLADAVTELNEKDRIEQGVSRAAVKYNLPENLIKGVIKAESSNNPRALSRAGAQGLMQLMPATARELGVVDAFDIEQNIDGGARYLRKMIDRYDGDVAKALAAYNAGPGTVDRFKGKVPYRETIAYVDRVLKYSQQYV